MFAHIVRTAKAYAAAAASIVAVLSGMFAADTEVGKILLIVSPILAWVATWKVPNVDLIEDESDPDNPVIVELDERDGPLEH